MNYEDIFKLMSGDDSFLLQNVLSNAGMPPLGEEAGMPVLGPTPGVGMPGSMEQGPPISGMAQPQQPVGFFDKASGMLKQAQLDPMFQMGLSLMANSRPSLKPQSFAGNLGMAGLQTIGMQRQQKMDDVKRKLLEAQAGLYGARASMGANPTGSNVAKTFPGENGNMWIIRRDGTPADTGVAYDPKLRFEEMADGSIVPMSPRTGEALPGGISPEQAADASTRAAQTEKQQTLPTDLAGLDTSMAKIDATIGKVERVLPLVKDSTVGVESRLRGDLPGMLGGEARQLKQAVKSLQANLGFDTLQQMRAASKTGGALGQVSERELDLLINAVEALDLEGDPEVLKENLNQVILHYNNYKREIEKMKTAMRQEAGQNVQSTQPTPTKRYNPATGQIEAY